MLVQIQGSHFCGARRKSLWKGKALGLQGHDVDDVLDRAYIAGIDELCQQPLEQDVQNTAVNFRHFSLSLAVGVLSERGSRLKS